MSEARQKRQPCWKQIGKQQSLPELLKRSNSQAVM
jgi:hypothetical protein